MGGKRYTSEQIDYLKSIAIKPSGVMAELFNERFHAAKNSKAMSDWCHKYRFLKGTNTGRFQKGLTPWNKNNPDAKTTDRPVGFERIDGDGYVRFKAPEYKTMVVKHRYVWERNNGPIPSGMMVTFRDGDARNCDIGNLMLISRSELVRYNNLFRKLANAQTNETCLLLAKLKDKTHKLKVA